jgi:hypothetical protein
MRVVEFTGGSTGSSLAMVCAVKGYRLALFERFRKEIAALAAEPKTFWTHQFHNTDAIDGYAGIGTELLEQSGGSIDAFCGGAGTGDASRRHTRVAGGRPPRPDRRARAVELTGHDRGPRWTAQRRRHRHGTHSGSHGRQAVRRGSSDS